MTNRFLLALSFLLLQLSINVTAQHTAAQLDATAKKYAAQSWDMFNELLSIPNDAHFPDFIEKNIVWCENAFQSRDFTIKRLATPTVPILLAERKVPNAAKTVLIYLQIDGQPADPRFWAQKSPWIPVLKAQNEEGKWEEIDWEKIYGDYDPDWRIFARSASDAKGPAAAFLTALDAAEELGIQPNYNIKVILDFEEELGSPHLPEAVEKYKEDFAADMMIIYDGPRHSSNEPTLTFGARGISLVTLTTYGPRVPQHSGHFGNYAPNPALLLAQLLSSMKDSNGRVSIGGWYDGIELTAEELAILKAVPDNEEEIMKKIGVARIDAVGNFYQESVQFPSLNIRGMASAWVGDEARTIVPATATAELDIRLVPESDPALLLDLLRRHLQREGFFVTENEPTEEERMSYPKIVQMNSRIAYKAFRTPFDSEVGIWLNNAMVRAFEKEPVKIRISGGSIPISPFVSTLNIPAVTVPTVNNDNNQHSPNENIRLGNYVDAVRTFLAIMGEKL